MELGTGGWWQLKRLRRNRFTRARKEAFLGIVDDDLRGAGGLRRGGVRARAIFDDSYVGAVRGDHPLARTGVTLSDYVVWSHVVAWRHGLDLGGVDDMLRDLGQTREIMTSVDGFSAALALARGTDLIATVPDRHTAGLRGGMFTFPVPLPARRFTISLLWHPRLDGDPAHRWLRRCVRAACQTKPGGAIRPGPSEF